LTALPNKEWTEEMEFHQTTDVQPILGTNYYRIKEVYVDGSFSYTDVKKVDFKASARRLIY